MQQAFDATSLLPYVKLVNNLGHFEWAQFLSKVVELKLLCFLCLTHTEKAAVVTEITQGPMFFHLLHNALPQ